MRLLIKQRVFSWTDSYDVYDENENAKYFVKAEFFSLGHQLHIYDRNDRELGVIRQRLFTLLPAFEIEIGGQVKGEIRKQFSFFKPRYEIDYNGWRVEGDFLGWDYDVNLDSNFLTVINNVSTEVAVYSIVNSLVELDNINKVQILVNGEVPPTFSNSTFERNLDYVTTLEQ